MYDFDAPNFASPTANEAGLVLDISHDFRENIRPILFQLDSVRQELEEDDKFYLIFYLIRAQVIDQAYNHEVSAVDFDSLLKLKGPNGSELHWDVFRPQSPLSCSPHTFEQRQKLKIRRTLLNLQQLYKAYENYQLQELQQQLEAYLDIQTSAGILRQKLLALSRTSSFSTYLELKNGFLKKWTDDQEPPQRKSNVNPLQEFELSETMRALLQQKPKLSTTPQILRYTDYRFFRRFNATPHPEINSSSIDFWRTEVNQNQFLKFVRNVRERYPVNGPFHVFRFEGSFTYLLCGFADDSIVGAIAQDSEFSPVYAKIIMRQSNGHFRELQSEEGQDKTLYYNCLKEAMLPFIEHLNRRLRIELTPEFIDFFRI